MKKNSTVPQSSKQGAKETKTCQGSITIGMDLGDKTSRYCALDEHGEAVLERARQPARKGCWKRSARWGVAGSRWKWGPTHPGSAGC
jgi:hypothetical protein